MIPGTAGATAALDSGARELTRVVALFSLTGRLDPRLPALGSLIDTFDFGRFALHLASSEAVLPVPVLVEDVAPAELGLRHGDHGLDLASLQIAVVATPRGDVTLALDCGFAGADSARGPRRLARRHLFPPGPDHPRRRRPARLAQRTAHPGRTARLRPERPPTRLPDVDNRPRYTISFSRVGSRLSSESSRSFFNSPPAAPPQEERPHTLRARPRGRRARRLGRARGRPYAGRRRHDLRPAVLQRTRLSAFETMRANERGRGRVAVRDPQADLPALRRGQHLQRGQPALHLRRPLPPSLPAAWLPFCDICHRDIAASDGVCLAAVEDVVKLSPSAAGAGS